MERIEKLRSHPGFREALEKIEQFEQDRIYCRHDMPHFLDVARISSLIAMEEQADVPREQLYAAALLHDIGRAFEYEGKCSHESGSVVTALKLLPECGFQEDEVRKIAGAIAVHRERERGEVSELGNILYRADKLSRPCYHCRASKSCKWEKNKKNHKIVY